MQREHNPRYPMDKQLSALMNTRRQYVKRASACSPACRVTNIEPEITTFIDSRFTRKKPLPSGPILWVSRPKGLHLRPLAEPDVTVSRHPAPIRQTHRRCFDASVQTVWVA